MGFHFSATMMTYSKLVKPPPFIAWTQETLEESPAALDTWPVNMATLVGYEQAWKVSSPQAQM